MPPTKPLKLKLPANQPPMGEGNWKQNIQYVFYVHRYFFVAWSRSQGWPRLMGSVFLALTIYNFLYAAVLFPIAVNAQLSTEGITQVGEAFGEFLFDSAWSFMDGIYTNGEFGLLPALSQASLWGAAPIAAAGVVESMAADDDLVGTLKKPWVLGSWFLVLLLTGGGKFFGQLYDTLVRILEGILRQVTDFLNIFETLKETQAFSSVNATIAASVAECQKFIGQEQTRCILEASEAAKENLLKVDESLANGTPWLTARIETLSDIAEIIRGSNSLTDIAFNAFMGFAQPWWEAVLSIIATAVLTAINIGYVVFIAFYGLILPIVAISALLSPVMRSGLFKWLITLVQIWAFRALYLIVMFMLSRILLSTSAEQFFSTTWFMILSALVAPYLLWRLTSGSAQAAYSGIISDTTKAAITSGQVAMGAAIGGPAGATAAAATGASSNSADVSKPPRVAVD